ncbi:translocation/assembly module TamB domain-containing protein [Lysobacter olei]
MVRLRTPSVLLLMQCAVLCALLLAAAGAHARAMTARIQRVTTAAATLQDVQVRLEWNDDAGPGRLHLRAGRADAPELGYRLKNVSWQCPLRRDGQGGWRCEGDVRAAGGPPFRLAVALGVAVTEASLVRGPSRLHLLRNAATPDVTRIDLTDVPLAWTQALLATAWPAARLNAGQLSGRLDIDSAAGQPLRVSGPLRLRGVAIDTPDGTIAAEGLGGDLDVRAAFADTDTVSVRGQLRGGEMLFGTTYVSLQDRRVGLRVAGQKRGEGGWDFHDLHWQDDGILVASGRASLTPEGSLHSATLRLESGSLAPLRDGYLSGWLGLAGLGDLALSGAADAWVDVANGQLRGALMRLHGVTIDDPQGRFDFNGLDGDVAFSGGAPVQSALQWQGGALYGLAFGPARLPFASEGGELRVAAPVTLPVLGGYARFDDVRIRPPAADRGLEVEFGLALDRVDIAQLSKALDWPAFTGNLSGSIPRARYANDRLDFDGGLDMQLFNGRVRVSSLAMERPFGVAPTLTADIDIDDLDLESTTGVFGFGSITGALDGRISGLRLVDWQPVAFDAQLRTERKRGLRQRISQRAVQNISSVGDASFVSSLQGQLIGLFDDFGYKRIGIACRLVDEVCTMDGLGSAGQGFIIVEGAGLPRLTVVGFNRRVDWPTLLERLAAIGKGDVKPVVE